MAISPELLARVDELAKRLYTSRSQLIRMALLQLFLEKYKREHPETKLYTPPED